MKNTKGLIFSFLILVLLLNACKDKRHDLSKAYRLDHTAFVLISAITSRELYLNVMRDALQEKKKTLLSPARTDTLKGDQQHLDACDTLFFQSDELLREPVKEINVSGNTGFPDNFTRKEKAWLKEQVDSLETVFHEIYGTYGRFSNYYKDAAYKEDKGMQGLVLIDSMNLLNNKFRVVSDSIILRSNRLFKDIYNVPDRQYPFGAAAALMEQSIKACSNYIVLQERLYGVKQPDTPQDRALKFTKNAIDTLTNQLAQLEMLGSEKSIWADVLVLKFKELLFSFRTYYEVRLSGPDRKDSIQKTDLGFLKDQENRMRSCYTIFLKL